jgi:Glycosyltransferase family 87
MFVRRILVVLTAGFALLSAAATSAQASTGVGLPLAPSSSATIPPPGFSTNALQAIKAAEATPRMRALHRREHPLRVDAFIWNGQRWYIDFSYRNKLTAEVDVSPAGRVAAVWTGPLALAVYARGNYAPLFDSPWVLVPFSVLFLVPFLDPRRLFRIRHLDALVVLSLLVSFVLFEHTKLEAAVWLVYPPLLYLLARMLQIGTSRHRSHQQSTSWLSPRVLWLGLAALVVARVALSLAEHTVIDVGYASVIGAHRIAHGQSLYFAAAGHGDTYGPITYLAYLPFELVFPWRGSWNYLASAHAAAIFFDLVTIGGLLVLGRRLGRDRADNGLGLRLAWAWAACPFTLLGLMMHTNDGLLAMLAVLGLLALSAPAARGAILGLAAAAKFFPALLLGLYAVGRRASGKGAARAIAGFALVAGGVTAIFLPSGGLGELYDHTIGYQLSRSDVFSLWSLHPSLDAVKVALEVGAIGLAAGAGLIAARRSSPSSTAQFAGLAAAVTIALELSSTHWFYYYLVWFLPYAFVALLAPADPPAGEGEDHAAPALGRVTSTLDRPSELTTV